MKNKILIIIVSLLMTGCYNYNELNDIAIISGLGIDIDNNNLKISALVANGQSLNSNSKEGNAQPTLITGTGKNFTEAIKDIESKSAYQRLNAAAISKVAPGGFIFTYSCSQVVDKESFALAVFSAAAQCGRSVRILDRLNQPCDHSVNIYHPEGEYLKGLLLYVE